MELFDYKDFKGLSDKKNILGVNKIKTKKSYFPWNKIDNCWKYP